AHIGLAASHGILLASLVELARSRSDFAEAAKQQAELILGFHGAWIEGNGAFEILLCLVILVLSQQNAPELYVRGRMLRRALDQVSKDRDSPILLANRVIRKTKVIGSSNLVGLRLKALPK